MGVFLLIAGIGVAGASGLWFLGGTYVLGGVLEKKAGQVCPNCGAMLDKKDFEDCVCMECTSYWGPPLPPINFRPRD